MCNPPRMMASDQNAIPSHPRLILGGVGTLNAASNSNTKAKTIRIVSITEYLQRIRCLPSKTL